MSQNTYYIIACVAIVFTIYLIFVLTYAKKRKKKQLKEFDNLKPLNRNQKHALVFGVILAYHRGEEFIELKPKKSIDTYIYGLKDSWEIYNKEDAIEVLEALVSLERSTEFDKYLAEHSLAVNASSKELHKIRKKIAKGLKFDIETIQHVKSTFAWDICRCVSLAKWCFWCGYINEDECWDFILRAVNIAQSKGNNWEDYTISFLLGRTMQGFDLEDLIIGAEQLLSQRTLLGKKEHLTIYSKFPYK